MRVALSLWFDEALERQIYELWQQVEQKGISSILYDGRFRPHITLGIWEFPDHENIIAPLRKLLSDVPPLQIRFESVGNFPGTEGVVFLAPIVTATLINLHSKVFSLASAKGDSVSEYYRPGAWVPHCTCAYKISPSEVLTATQVCLQQALPLEGEAASLGIIQTPEEIELDRVEFNVHL